jgi:diaminopimelate decarboxylase
MKDTLGSINKIKNMNNYFAVKACPNIEILRRLAKLGHGFDCSSLPELRMAKKILKEEGRQELGAIMYTGNNMNAQEISEVVAPGVYMNLDDITDLDRLPQLPSIVSFRYNPGKEVEGNSIIGKPTETKFGVPAEMYPFAYQKAQELGATRFAAHTMMASNCLDNKTLVDTLVIMLRQASEIYKALGIQFEYINLGGGYGIPYHPSDTPLNLDWISAKMQQALASFAVVHPNYTLPRIVTECGRYVTGPNGVLITRVNSVYEKYHSFIGVDACMSNLMRPGMYGAYHHITTPYASLDAQTQAVDVVGSLCESNDVFAKQRRLPDDIKANDPLIIHDVGAHGHAMTFQYNARLRGPEYLLEKNGNVRLIRRAETEEDYWRTCQEITPSAQDSYWKHSGAI